MDDNGPTLYDPDEWEECSPLDAGAKGRYHTPVYLLRKETPCVPTGTTSFSGSDFASPSDTTKEQT